MEIATWEKEKHFHKKGYNIIVGVDEVGRGPLAGPVVVSACVIRDIADFNANPEDEQWKLVRDSKLLSEKQRKTAFAFVKEKFYVGVGQSNPSTIDRINILQATFLAMKKAIADVEHVMDKERAYQDAEKMMIMIDGNQVIPHFTREQVCVAKGDQVAKSIAAASVIAKVLRDNLMEKYDKKYPEYGFAKHKGYGTAQHIQALNQYGATPIHRTSFAPVRNVL
ncbi:MAG: ribonuclease HII [Candidatus Moraniibacteriota bacterium]|nr:MAG: ribonuclease HII [Candidatus Moranbacteria bacterium]